MTVFRSPFSSPFGSVFGSPFGAAPDPDPILAMFASGEQGVYSYPTNAKAPDGDYINFTDVGGTIPAGADDIVRFIRDLSPNEHHFKQSDIAKGFALKTDGSLWWWDCDGVDDGYETDSAFVNIKDGYTAVSSALTNSDVTDSNNTLSLLDADGFERVAQLLSMRSESVRAVVFTDGGFELVLSDQLVVSGEKFVGSVIADAVEIRAFFNDAAASSTPSPDNLVDLNQNLALGRHIIINQPQFWEGKIFSTLYVQRPLSSSELLVAKNDAANKAGMVL